MYLKLVEVHSAHSLVKLLLRKLHLQKKQLDYLILLVLHKLQEREITLVLDLYLDSVDVQKQLLGITTRLPLMYSVLKTMVLSVLLQQFWKTMVLSAILLLQEKRTMVQLSILLPHILLQAQLILLVLLRLQKQMSLLVLVLYSQHQVLQRYLFLITNQLISSLLLVQLQSLGLEIMLDLDLYSVSVDVSRKSPSTITTVLLLSSHL